MISREIFRNIEKMKSKAVVLLEVENRFVLRPKRSKLFRHVHNWVSLLGLLTDENWFALIFCEKCSLHLLCSSQMHINVVKIVNLTIKVIYDLILF
jgi:hypothetical protein